jgi:peptidoglycan hydrolase-like protein with peptidoglycan-binding domain
MAKKILGVLIALFVLAVAGVALAEVPAACTGITFTRYLSQGMSGSDVKCLQALLNQDPATKVAETGPGSPGNETTYFGPLTKAAVIKFQEKYASEILAPYGLTAGTGYVGPKTIAKLNSMLGGAAPTPTPTPAPTPTPTPPTGEEGTLSAADVPLPSAVTLYEGDTNVGVMAFKLAAAGSPITVQRIDVQFNFRPWGCLSYVSLFDGANPIIGKEAIKDNFVLVSGTTYKMRFSGLSFVVPKDSSKTITVKVSAVPLFASGCPGTYTVNVPENGVRGVDGIGVNVYAPPTGSALTGKQFTLATVTPGTITASLSATTPAEGVAIIDQTTRTEVELAKFDLKASNADITLTEVIVHPTGYDGVLVALRLYDGTDLLAEATPAATTTFSDLLISIAKDTTKTLTVKGLAEATTTVAVGDVAVTLKGYSGTDVNDNDVSTSTLTIAGNTIHLYTVAPVITLDSTSISKASDEKSAEFTIKFKVTAKGGDVYVGKDSNVTNATSAHAVTAWYEGGTPTTTPAGIMTYTGTVSGDYVKVAKDTTETFTVKMTIDNTGKSSAYYRAKIYSIAWGTDGTSDVAYWTAPWAVGTLITDYTYLRG